MLHLTLLIIGLSTNLQTADYAGKFAGYSWPPSVAKGKEISFYCHSDSEVTITILRAGREETLITVLGPFRAQRQSLPENVVSSGCNWPPMTTLTIPDNWPSGIYLARFDNREDKVFKHLFVVRPQEGLAFSKMLYVCPLNTYQGYNYWGTTKQLISDHELDKAVLGTKDCSHVSFERPLAPDHFNLFDQPMIRWLEKQNYQLDYITDWDLHRKESLGAFYHLIIFSGHSEFWTRQMYDKILLYRNNGGNLAFFSAKAILRQVRYSEQQKGIICYHNIQDDPLLGEMNHLVTGRWRDPPLLMNEASLLGVRWEEGNAHNSLHHVTVSEPEHWIFGGLELDKGQPIGRFCLGGYWDSMPERGHRKLDVLTQTTMCNASRKVSNACAVYYRHSPEYGYSTGNGGQVFAAGNALWGRCLDDSCTGCAAPVIERMTANIINRFTYQESDKINNLSLSYVGKLLQLDWITSSPNPITNDIFEVRAFEHLPDFVMNNNLWQEGQELLTGQINQNADGSFTCPLNSLPSMTEFYLIAKVKHYSRTSIYSNAVFVNQLKNQKPLIFAGGVLPLQESKLKLWVGVAGPLDKLQVREQCPQKIKINCTLLHINEKLTLKEQNYLFFESPIIFEKQICDVDNLFLATAFNKNLNSNTWPYLQIYENKPTQLYPIPKLKTQLIIFKKLIAEFQNKKLPKDLNILGLSFMDSLITVKEGGKFYVTAIALDKNGKPYNQPIDLYYKNNVLFSLYDTGKHNDAHKSDGIFGNSVVCPAGMPAGSYLLTVSHESSSDQNAYLTAKDRRFLQLFPKERLWVKVTSSLSWTQLLLYVVAGALLGFIIVQLWQRRL